MVRRPAADDALETLYIGSIGTWRIFAFRCSSSFAPTSISAGFAGTLASGIVRRGDEVVVLPSRQRSRVRSIVTYDGELDEAFARPIRRPDVGG